MNDDARRWVVSVRVACAAGACSCVLALPACNPDNSGGSPDSGTLPDSGTGADSKTATDSGTAVESSSPDGGSAIADSNAEDGDSPDALADSGDARGSTEGGNDGGCPALLPDATTYVPNLDGDQCIYAPPNSCFNKFAGLWSCAPTNNGNSLLINTNGYLYAANNIGQVGEGCQDCSGNWTSISDGQGWVNVGTFTINDGGTTASLDWNYCSGSTLPDLQACKQATTSYPYHSNCTLAVSCAGP